MSSEKDVETKYCSNCKKDISATNFTMHEMHCRRHLVLCKHCEEPVPRTELEQHFNDVHAKVACTLCGTEVEKEQLETHMKSDCPKRKVPCEYCELEVPQNELAEHVGYCGTRTEACPRCSAYIMQKDLLRHNSSNCTYPPPATSTTTTSNITTGGFAGMGTHGADGDGRGAMDDMAFREFFGYRPEQLSASFDPFTFEEIQQALVPGMMEETYEQDMPSIPLVDSDASAAAGEGGMVVDMGKQFSDSKNEKVPLRKNGTRSRQQKNDRGNARKSSTNRRSDLNRQRDAEQAIPPDMDYETLLAMQFDVEDADEPDPDSHLNQLINKFEKHERQPLRNMSIEEDVPASPPPQNHLDAADEVMIPCEFCGETFPAFALVHHQSVCDPLASGLWGSGEDIPPMVGRNNESSRWRPVDSRPAIPVINNLGSASPGQETESRRESYHLTDNGDYQFNSLENIMLPCEFCCELLPADFLVQHQAICEGNPSTPRVTTPAAAQPSSGFTPGGPRNHFFPTSTARSRNHQPDPTEELWAAISRGGEEENDPGNSRMMPKKRPNVPKGPSSFNKNIPVSVVRHGRVDTSSRSGMDSRRPVDEGHQSDMLLHARRSKPSNQGRSDNSNHIRHTLNCLLTVDDPVGPGNAVSSSHRKVPNTGSTGVSSRSVVQTMQREDRQRANRRPSADQEQSDLNSDHSGRRQRERGDHVFNGSDNTRNQPNQARSRSFVVPNSWGRGVSSLFFRDQPTAKCLSGTEQ